MKKLFLSFVFVVATSNMAIGQVHFGVKGGLAQSQLHGDPSSTDSYERRNGFYAGGFIEIPMGKYAIQPEFLFSTSGGEVIRKGATKETTIYLNTNNINIPIVAKVILESLIPGLGLEAGPSFTYRMASSVIKWDREEINKDAFKSFDLGIDLGAAYYFNPIGKSFFIEIRWNKNFLNILNTSNQEVKDLDLSGGNTLSNSVGRIGVGYRF